MKWILNYPKAEARALAKAYKTHGMPVTIGEPHATDRPDGRCWTPGELRELGYVGLYKKEPR